MRWASIILALASSSQCSANWVTVARGGAATTRIVASVGGKKLDVAGATVSDVQAALQESVGLDSNRIGVMFKGERLHGGQVLSEAGVADGDTLTVHALFADSYVPPSSPAPSPSSVASAAAVSQATVHAACSAHASIALAEFMESLPDLGAELGGAFDTFGDICDEAIDQTLGTFDALSADLDSASIKQAKRKELLGLILRELDPIYRGQLKQLDDLAWDRMRKGLVKLRLGDPSLLADMEAAVTDADRFFRDTSKRMNCQGSAWSADRDRRNMVTKMRAFVTERLQAARLQGSYVPGMLRRPVAVSLHYLATRPFDILDSLQDGLSYEEDFDWEPDPRLRKASSGGVTRDLSSLKGLDRTTRRMAERAER